MRSGPITLNRSLSATNPSVVVPREPVQRSLSFSTANPQNSRGSKIGATSIVNSNPATPQTPETPGSPHDIDLDDEAFAVPESPASTAGGSKVIYFRKIYLFPLICIGKICPIFVGSLSLQLKFAFTKVCRIDHLSCRYVILWNN